MTFSKKTKEEAKERAHYMCVICHDPFLEVHHIVPEAEEGDDTIENAAPLCAGCHHTYGGNPDLRKQLQEMRDFWWKHCEKKETENIEILMKLDQLKSQYEEDKGNQGRILQEIKDQMVQAHNDAIENIQSAPSLPDVEKSSASSVKLGNKVYANFVCSNCGTNIGLMIGRDTCPQCGKSV